MRNEPEAVARPGSGGGERRRDRRHPTCFPAYVDGAGPRCPGLVRDLSASGALVLTRRPIAVGASVKLRMYVEDSFNRANPRFATGRIVRAERRSPEAADIWPHSVAVHFDPPIAALVPVVEALSVQLAARGIND